MTDMLKATRFNASDLMKQEFPPAVEVVPGMITAGLNLIVAPPKAGKSWLMLDLALAAASGGNFLGSLPISKRPVLYMALEDGFRRLQRRMRTMGWGDDAPKGLDFLIQAEEGRSPTDTIRDFVTVNEKHSPLVVLDTLGKVKPLYPKKSAGESDYEREYRLMAELKQAVDGVDGASLVVVHHTRKDTATGDFVDSVSGTNGLAGAADSIIALVRERGQSQGTLKVTSRDASEGEYSVAFDGEHGRWSLAGGSLPEAMRTAHTGRLVDGLGESLTDIIECVNRHPEGVTPLQVSQELEMPQNRVRRYLRRAVESERVSNQKRGVYEPCSSALGVTTVTLPLEAKQENGSQIVTPRIYDVTNVTIQAESDTSDTSDTPTAGDSDTSAVHLNADAQAGEPETQADDHDETAFLNSLPTYPNGVDFKELSSRQLEAISECKPGLWHNKAGDELKRRAAK
jgi:hypothetical protein